MVIETDYVSRTFSFLGQQYRIVRLLANDDMSALTLFVEDDRGHREFIMFVNPLYMRAPQVVTPQSQAAVPLPRADLYPISMTVSGTAIPYSDDDEEPDTTSQALSIPAITPAPQGRKIILKGEQHGKEKVCDVQADANDRRAGLDD